MSNLIIRQTDSGPFAPFGFFEVFPEDAEPVTESWYFVSDRYISEGETALAFRRFLVLHRTYKVTNLGEGKAEVRPVWRPRWMRRLFGDDIKIVDVTAASV